MDAVDIFNITNIKIINIIVNIDLKPLDILTLYLNDSYYKDHYNNPALSIRFSFGS